MQNCVNNMGIFTKPVGLDTGSKKGRLEQAI
jgi:hypothetical protein